MNKLKIFENTVEIDGKSYFVASKLPTALWIVPWTLSIISLIISISK